MACEFYMKRLNFKKIKFLLYLVLCSLKTHKNSDSLIHLLNIANVIPFIARLGIHFIFIHVVTYRGKINKTLLSTKVKKKKTDMDQYYLRQTYLKFVKYKAGVQSKTLEH